jgi:hypothetical protein
MKNLKTSFTISGKTLKSLDRLVGKGEPQRIRRGG